MSFHRTFRTPVGEHVPGGAVILLLRYRDGWISQWGEDFYRGRGVPGKTDVPPQ